MNGLPALVVTEDERHGVTIAARDLAAAVAAATGRRSRIAVARLLSEHPPPRAHLHFTDRLWARTAADAAELIERIATRTSLTVTLHDMPQASDGPVNLRRRTRCYARVVDVARGVVVNSQHEAALLSEAGIAPRTIGVVPLPVDPCFTGVPATRAGVPDVAVLGFFYPGKGHAEIVDGIDPEHARVTVLGGPSPGHEGELQALVAQAAARGVDIDVTGFVPEEELPARCRTAAVPVVAHRHFSASGSLTTWIAAGRRPLVVDSRYAREMATLRPGTVHLVAPARLTDSIRAALADPASTWLAPDAVTRPHLDDTAAAYVRWWSTEVAW